MRLAAKQNRAILAHCCRDLVREVAFLVLHKISDVWLIRCQCNPKALVNFVV
ncbi:Hypothetical protein FKW44_003728, partial [Caligus rogercresseyi]